MILDMIARLPELTEVDGSIVPLKELDDTTGLKSWHGAGFVVFGCERTNTIARVLYLYPRLDMNPYRIRLKNNLNHR